MIIQKADSAKLATTERVNILRPPYAIHGWPGRCRGGCLQSSHEGAIDQLDHEQCDKPGCKLSQPTRDRQLSVGNQQLQRKPECVAKKAERKNEMNSQTIMTHIQ